MWTIIPTILWYDLFASNILEVLMAQANQCPPRSERHRRRARHCVSPTVIEHGLYTLLTSPARAARQKRRYFRTDPLIQSYENVRALSKSFCLRPTDARIWQKAVYSHVCVRKRGSWLAISPLVLPNPFWHPYRVRNGENTIVGPSDCWASVLDGDSDGAGPPAAWPKRPGTGHGPGFSAQDPAPCDRAFRMHCHARFYVIQEIFHEFHQNHKKFWFVSSKHISHSKDTIKRVRFVMQSNYLLTKRTTCSFWAEKNQFFGILSGPGKPRLWYLPARPVPDSVYPSLGQALWCPNRPVHGPRHH